MSDLQCSNTILSIKYHYIITLESFLFPNILIKPSSPEMPQKWKLSQFVFGNKTKHCFHKNWNQFFKKQKTAYSFNVSFQLISRNKLPNNANNTLRILSHLLKKSLAENLIFCAVSDKAFETLTSASASKNPSICFIGIVSWILFLNLLLNLLNPNWPAGGGAKSPP